MNSFYFYGIEKIDKADSFMRGTIAAIKSFQTPELMAGTIKLVFGNKQLKQFIKRKKIDTIAVIPNNAVRKISFNEEIEKYLKKHYPELQFIKITVNDFPERKTQKSTR